MLANFLTDVTILIMKTLLLMRHAKSSWDNMNLSDHDRPLNKRGKGDAPKMAVLLKREGLVPDSILSSSANRAFSTAELVHAYAGVESEIVVKDGLYHSSAESIRSHIADYGAGNILLVVGHNPGMGDIVEILSQSHEAMVTAALAHLRLTLLHGINSR